MKETTPLTIDDIIVRFEKAASTMRRLPPVQALGFSSWWPDIVYSNIEKLQMELKPERAIATPEEIVQMEETCRWLRFLTHVDDRRLVWLRAERVRWKLICLKLGMTRQTANRRWKNALTTICHKVA